MLISEKTLFNVSLNVYFGIRSKVNQLSISDQHRIIRND